MVFHKVQFKVPYKLYLYNNIVNSAKITEFILCADDTNLFYKDNNLNNLILKINKELENISTWSTLNKLSLNKKNKLYCV